jgi:hypothetical protein
MDWGSLFKRYINQMGDIDLRQIWKKQDQRNKESLDVLTKFRSILKKFVEIVIFLEEFLKEYTHTVELQENNFYQIAILLAIIRLFLKVFLLACLNSETKIE